MEGFLKQLLLSLKSLYIFLIESLFLLIKECTIRNEEIGVRT